MIEGIWFPQDGAIAHIAKKSVVVVICLFPVSDPVWFPFVALFRSLGIETLSENTENTRSHQLSLKRHNLSQNYENSYIKQANLFD